MKKMRFFGLAFAIVAATAVFQSCSDDVGYPLGFEWVSIVTIESLNEGADFFYRLDDGSTLWPSAGYYRGHNLEDGQRALLNYTILSDSLDGFSHFVKVNSIDPILTKKIAEDKGEENDVVYGTDPVSVQSMWIDNGFLHVWFKANFGGSRKHFINLVQANADVPYELEFRHNAYDDPQTTSIYGIVCFNLSDLPDTDGEEVTLTIRLHTFEGDETIELIYNSAARHVQQEMSYPYWWEPIDTQLLN
ncbi:NigD-like protein [Bacteroidales bacterium Barb6XT]|nr:NigD-like protein [Bacteroidales bacterium Barb6XT]